MFDLDRIRLIPIAIHRQPRGFYGARRISEELQAEG
jgi:hypothetical protein